MGGYQNHYNGEQVNILDTEGRFIFSGIITKMGTFHATINELKTGYNHDVVYNMIQKQAAVKKIAQAEIIKEDEKEGKKFILSKEENNVDGSLSVRYEVTVDDKMVWESEEIVTNVYDDEKGWSAPDDFDDNKLDLIQQTAESGFDMIVDSYNNMKALVEDELALPAEGEPGEDGAAATGTPAFAPGEGPNAGGGGGGGAGATMIGGDEGDTLEGDGAEAGDTVEEGGESEVGGADPFAEEPEDALPLAASLDRPSFARSILAEKIRLKGDERLHGNPEHRLNPALREEMKRRNIDSGDTHDIELSERLKDFDYGKSSKASIERIKSKISNLTQEK